VELWDSSDAIQVLADSPWVKKVRLERLRDLSPDERRQAGDWQADEGHGVGLAALAGLFNPALAAEAIARAHMHPDPGSIVVRWESALPVRAAEVKAGEAGIPSWKGDYYAIAVYGITPRRRFNLENELKGISYIRPDKKKDFKPVKVTIQWHDDGSSTIVYLFSRSHEISRKDANLQFVAQVDRFFVSQFFFPAEMVFLGQPEY